MDNVPVHSNNQVHVERNVGGRPSGASRTGKSKKNKFKNIIIAAGVVVIAALLVVLGLFMYRSSTSSAIDSSKYQVVFLTENSFYFGKLHTLNNDYMRLTDIFYIQSSNPDSPNPQGTDETPASSLELIKLGNEIHGPEDEMIISKDKILYFENLKNDGKVSKLIADYKNQNK